MQAAVRGTDFYETYTGTILPLTKMDLMAIPGRGGAIENWGLIQFDERRMLFNQVLTLDRPLCCLTGPRCCCLLHILHAVHVLNVLHAVHALHALCWVKDVTLTLICKLALAMFVHMLAQAATYKTLSDRFVAVCMSKYSACLAALVKVAAESICNCAALIACVSAYNPS